MTCRESSLQVNIKLFGSMKKKEEEKKKTFIPEESSHCESRRVTDRAGPVFYLSHESAVVLKLAGGTTNELRSKIHRYL